MGEKLTRWIPATIKPVRKGWYECAYADEGLMFHPFHYWDGKHWNGPDSTKYQCSGGGRYPSSIPDSKWRGLATKPKGAK